MSALAPEFSDLLAQVQGNGKAAPEKPKVNALAPAFADLLEQASKPKQTTPVPSVPLGAGANDAFDNGISFGVRDQISALGRATGNEVMHTLTGKGDDLSFGQRYRKALADERDRGASFASAHPYLNAGAKGAGMLASAALMPGLKAPATLPAGIFQGAKIGAGVGALSGAASSDLSNPTETATKAAIGAGGGALVGGAVPVASEYASRILGPALEKLRLTSPDTTATNAVRDAIIKDRAGGGPGTAEISARLGQTPGMSVADIGGQNVKALGGATYRSGGPASNFIRDTLNARDEQAGTLLSDAIDSGIARGGSNFTTAANLENAASEKAAPLYKQAFAANSSIDSPALNRVLKTPFGQTALSTARERMANKMTLMGTPDQELTARARDLASIGKMAVPRDGIASGMKLQAWDQIKQAMDEEINSLRRGVMSGTAKRGDLADAISLKNGFVRELDRLDSTAAAGPNSVKPEGGLYAQARSAYAGPYALKDAMEEGATIFKKHPDEITNDISGLTPSERDHYLLGAGNALKDRIARTSNSANEANKVIGNEMLRKQLRPLFASERGYQKFIQTARDVGTQFETRSKTMLGSPPAERLAADLPHHGALGDIVRGATALAEGAPIASTLSFAKAGGRALGGVLGRRSDATNMAIAKLLYGSDPRSQSQLLMSLMRPARNWIGLTTVAPVGGGVHLLLNNRSQTGP